MTSKARVARPRRIAAVIALLAAAVFAFAVVSFLFRHGVHVVYGVAGLLLAVAGGWWAVTEAQPRRTIGALGAVGGVVVIAIAFVNAINGIDRIVLRVAVTTLALVVAMVAARRAAMPDEHDAGLVTARRAPPQHPVLLCNPWSGGGKVEQFGLLDRARELGVETVLLDHGLDLEQLARDAVARGADCLGMAGGDGSQALVASIAVEHDLPFVCISAGTRNHFALDLGLDREDPRASMDAFRDAVERRIDFATVNDRFFVNNVSLGVYATIVQEDSYRDAKVETTTSKLPEMLGRQAEPFDLQFTTPTGDEVDGAILVMVSNNPYVIGASLDAAQRRRLDTGELGVFAVTTRTGAAAAQLLALTAVGQRHRSPNWHEFTASAFEVRSRGAAIFAGIDGEALELEAPLRFRSHPGGLTLLVPERSIAEARRRGARDARVRDLVTIARGWQP